MSESAEEKGGEVRRRRRAWWQWVLGAGLLGAACVLLVLRLFPGLLPARQLRVKPQEVRVLPELREVNAFPAAAGDYAGCNLLLVTLDTTKATHVGCYGNRKIETPTLDQLAREGVLFSDVVCPVPLTLPSHSSLMTGLYPYHHGARANAVYRLEDDRVTLAEILSERGYVTGATVSSFVLDSRFGIAQGFRDYNEDMDKLAEDKWLEFPERPANKTGEQALAWLRDHHAERFFLWVHFYDPHMEYEPPPPFDERYKDMPYDGEIAFVDSELAKLIAGLDELGLTDKTLVVAVGDHGEGLGEHLESGHGYLLYDSTMHVPLIMRCGRRLGGGVHYDRPTSIVDLMPTVLAMLGVDGPAGMDGVDLTQASNAKPSPLFLETLHGMVEDGWAPLLGVQEGSVKYVYGPEPELYDLADDPFEDHNLIASRPKVAEKMQRELRGFFGKDLEKAVAAEPTRDLTPEERAKLATLGYTVSAHFGEEAASGPRPNPKDMLKLNRVVNEAVRSVGPEHLDQAIKKLEEVAREHPDFYSVHKLLGLCYEQHGDLERAEASFGRCLELREGMALPLIHMGRVKRKQRDFGASETYYREFLRTHPDNVGVLRELGEVLSLEKKYDEAADTLARALQLEPTSPELMETTAVVMVQDRRFDEAIAIRERLLAAQPEEIGVRSRLAHLLNEQGKYAEAEAVLREGLRLHAGKPELAADLALVLAHRPDRSIYMVTESITIMEQLCRDTGYTEVGYVRALGDVYAAAGRYADAAEAAEKALRLASASGQPEIVQALSQEVQTYKQLEQRVGAASRTAPGGPAGPTTAPAGD